jgi:uncharacterized YigZ family protein
MDEYRIPTGDAEVSFEEKHSRFLTHIWHTETEEEALARLKWARETYWDATHNVYAYILRGNIMRYSDDGEPQGTAGMPVLEVLRREELYEVTCVVTRYFGGTLLGAGGLIRAYSRGAKQAVDAAGVSMLRVWSTVEIPCPYNLFERMKLEIAAMGGILADTEYGADILLRAMVPQADAPALLARIVDLSNGRVTARIAGEAYRAFPVDPH